MTTPRPRPLAAVLLVIAVRGASAAVEIAACTESGTFTIALDATHAPEHAANFLGYVDRGAYSGTVFHRVVANELVQAGGHDADLRPVVPLPPVPNESHNGLSNLRGTIAAARAADPDSATSQFFVNISPNTHLDATDTAPGYTVFGRVTEGLETLEAISRLPTRAAGPFAAGVPEPLVEIVSMARLDRGALEAVPAAERRERLRERVLAAAREGEPGDVIAAMERYRSTCTGLDPDVLLAEAEAAATLDRGRRARSALAQYFERAAPADTGRERAAALRAALTPRPISTLERIAPGCAAPMPSPVPDGATASHETMLKARNTVRRFMDDSGAFLDCLSILIDEADLTERERAVAVREHNRHIDLMETHANQFNGEVREFRGRE